MIRQSCPSSLPYTSENRLVFVLILAVALMSVARGAQAQIAFASARGGDLDIYVMDEDGSNVTQLTNHPHTDSGPVWSPDGTRIAFSSLRDDPMNIDRNWEVYVMDANGGNPVRLTQEPLVDGLPAWSPYGNRIAFASNRHGTGDIYVMNDGGGNVRRLTHDDTNRSPYDWAPAWSPSGRFIAFESTRGGRGSDIWLMNSDGTKPVLLAKPPAHDTSPSWSPDGMQIAFASRDGENFTWEIHRIDVDGGGLQNLTNNAANDTRPAWSPSGEQIAFSSDRDGDYDIYVMSRDGGKRAQAYEPPYRRLCSFLVSQHVSGFLARKVANPMVGYQERTVEIHRLPCLLLLCYHRTGNETWLLSWTMPRPLG